MTIGSSVRFWQPAREAAPALVCAYLEEREAPPHIHEEWQFGVLETWSKLSIGAFRRHSAHADDVTIVHPYEVHTEGGALGTPPRWRMLYVPPAILSRLHGTETLRFRRPVVTDPAAAAKLRELLRLSQHGTVKEAEFLSQVAHWLELFLASHAEDIAAPKHMPAVERARTYLQDRPTQPVTLPEVGVVARVTISHLVRSFSRSVGLPPKSYHAQVRLARARRLLAEGKSATWVAYECGFADQSHLSRRFKESYGITPGAFQAQYRAESKSFTAVESSAA
jgi:AraC-like DNA-binding protein